MTTRGEVAADVGRVAAVARATLNDPRGWSLGGSIAFDQVPTGGHFQVVLASPSVIEAAAPICSTRYSCRVGDEVSVNDVRWRSGTPSWTRSLEEYQRYVIIHEVGHWLGLGHADCPGPGSIAPVMHQQSTSLDGCVAKSGLSTASATPSPIVMGSSTNTALTLACSEPATAAMRSSSGKACCGHGTQAPSCAMASTASSAPRRRSGPGRCSVLEASRLTASSAPRHVAP